MIPNRWYPLLESREVGHKPVGVRRMGEALVLFRGEDGRVRCFSDRCPHRGVALHLGKVVGDELECRYHGFRFDGEGRCTLMPCEGKGAHVPTGLDVTSFPVRDAHGMVWLWWGASAESLGLEELPDVPWFDELPASMEDAYGSSFEWPLNYTRTIESNFDIHHTPFVHKSVMPGVGTLIDPIHVEERKDGLLVEGRLRKDDGRSVAESPGLPFYIAFKSPCLTYLSLTKKIGGVILDCPIDEENTWRYGRYHHGLLEVPLLGRLVSWLLLTLEWSIVQKRQDLPVVITQEPRLPTPHCDKLVRADAGTAAYLKLRRRLLEEETRNLDILPPHVLRHLPAARPAEQPRRLPVVHTASRHTKGLDAAADGLL